MDGSPLHQHQDFQAEVFCDIHNLRTKRQVQAREPKTGQLLGFIDRGVWLPDGRLFALEFELTSRLISADILKSRAGGAYELMIVTPNAKVRKQCKLAIKRLTSPAERHTIFVGTQPQCQKRLVEIMQSLSADSIMT